MQPVKAKVRILSGPRKVSAFISRAGLGITGVGTPSILEISYKPGEAVDEVRRRLGKEAVRIGCWLACAVAGLADMDRLRAGGGAPAAGEASELAAVKEEEEEDWDKELEIEEKVRPVRIHRAPSVGSDPTRRLRPSTGPSLLSSCRACLDGPLLLAIRAGGEPHGDGLKS